MIEWKGEYREEGELVFRVGREGDTFVAEWTDYGTLRSDPTGRDVRFEPAPGADPLDLERLRTGFASALVRQLRGELSLHASVCHRGGRAIVFAGVSGAGKSSLAAALCALPGVSLGRDDFAPIDWQGETPMVVPGDAYHRVHEEAATALGLAEERAYSDGKLRVPAPRAATEPARLAALVTLVFDDAAVVPTLRRLHGQGAIAPLVTSVMRFAIDEPARHMHELMMFERLYRSAPVYELRRPRDLSLLPRAAELVAGLFEGDQGHGHR